MKGRRTRLNRVIVALSSVLLAACMGETFELSITNQSSENIDYIDIQYTGFLGYAHKYYTDADLDIGQTDTIDVPIEYHYVWIYGDTLKWELYNVDDGKEVVLQDENASVYAVRYEITNQSSETIDKVIAFSS